ncbi:MAG: phosphoserine phosphatase SerB [Micavibrio aeruginosavorus]|uniref:Phosphoserine phosphatase n=1 Tax=Micavibrio aeruginosavorus TaxID=349221 RepID=A0A2W5N336_9BACT|nr:MAG: phosphoserine phosphatase SerB [Micavibrio aeruginosavorus]
MTHILTLVASDTPLSIAHLEILEKFVEEKGLGLNGKPVWLDPHKAADLPVQNPMTMEQMAQARARFAADQIDLLCMSAQGRAKKLLLADMDSTIVTTETLDELAAKAGIKDQIAAITARAMNGELDFHAALKERVGLLKDLPVTALHETLDETELCEGADVMVHHMKDRGATCVLVSGGFTFFTGAIAEQAGFHHHHGNELDHDGTVLVGTVGPNILDKEAKLAFLNRYTQELGLDLADTLAIGDGANDLPMLTAAGLGIGYRPKPLLEQSLLNILKYADLRGVLYAQGYKDL